MANRMWPLVFQPVFTVRLLLRVSPVPQPFPLHIYNPGFLAHGRLRQVDGKFDSQPSFSSSISLCRCPELLRSTGITLCDILNIFLLSPFLVILRTRPRNVARVALNFKAPPPQKKTLSIGKLTFLA